jgi:tryptophan synthase alpha chain
MNCFQSLFAAKKTFVGYLTAGHRGLDYTVEAACALVEGGVDILEIGLPFSDPVADGPTIQAAMTDALTHDCELSAVFDAIKSIKKRTGVPIVLFSYLNPLLHGGLKANLKQAKKHGVDAVLLVDMPLEESNEYFSICQKVGLEPVGLLSPTTPLSRVKAIDGHCHSFLYYVCRSGVTGVKSSLPAGFADKMRQLLSVCDAPVVCGFGIGDKVLAKQALDHADGFVVGSAFVAAMSEGASPAELKSLAALIDPR